MVTEIIIIRGEIIILLLLDVEVNSIEAVDGDDDVCRQCVWENNNNIIIFIFYHIVVVASFEFHD